MSTSLTMAAPAFTGDDEIRYPTVETYNRQGAETAGLSFPGVSQNTLLLYREMPPNVLLQVHPAYGKGSVIALGPMWVWRSTIGSTPETTETCLVIEIGDIRWFVLKQDRVVSLSPNELMFLLPNDALGLVMPAFDPALDAIFKDHVTYSTDHSFRFEEVGGGREEEDRFSEFSEEGQAVMHAAVLADAQTLTAENEDNKTAAKIIKFSAWLSTKILENADSTATKIESYAEKKTSTVKPTGKDVSTGTVKTSSLARKTTKCVATSVGKVTDKVSGKVNKHAEKHVVIKESDSERKKSMRRIVAASLEGYNEVSEALGQGYTQVLVKANEGQEQYTTKKYGPNAAHATGNVLAAGFYTGKAAHSARRVVSVKAMARSQAKHMAQAQAERVADVSCTKREFLDALKYRTASHICGRFLLSRYPLENIGCLGVKNPLQLSHSLLVAEYRRRRARLLGFEKPLHVQRRPAPKNNVHFKPPALLRPIQRAFLPRAQFAHRAESMHRCTLRVCQVIFQPLWLASFRRISSLVTRHAALEYFADTSQHRHQVSRLYCFQRQQLKPVSMQASGVSSRAS
ncbi:hypothetical protein FVE85_9215 [Porphyridium purpureum]|uniref:Senescence domain-containing protein n=1 Tax=Porphyridium purpureum TaxID=35688 RepID=A0A5J4YQ99_PORPP|nr:hypothetical protein FVE85_9215 [Porphyridium purpureum]|eukprot:POR5837..scf222_8